MSKTPHTTTSPEHYLQEVQNMHPLIGSHWGKMETLTPPQALWLYYEIEPDKLDFQDFIDYGDEESLWPVMQSAIANNNLPLLKNQLLDVPTFVRWLQLKRFKIPQVFREALSSSRNLLSESMLQTADDVKQIDFNRLPLPVLKCLGANIIAQFRRRQAKEKGEEIKISTVMQSNLLKKFIEECCATEGKLPSDDTVRQYIEQQFRNSKR